MSNYNGSPPWGPGQGPNQPQPGQQNYYGQGQNTQQPGQPNYYGQGQNYQQPYYNQAAVSQPTAQALSSEAAFFQSVYLWMCSGLVITALTAYMIFNSSFRYTLISSKGLLLFIFLAQIGLVVLIGVLAKTASPLVLRGLFLLYAASVGVTVSLLLVVYPQNVIFKAFFSASAVYGGMAVYGLVTKRSLQKWGAFLYMAALGVIVALLINFIANSPMAHYVISWFGVIIFAGLTAYDHQKLRVIHAGGFEDSTQESKVVILGALTLFLDFINLFIFIVRIMGAGRR
ncbi:MAG: Bax inhibitor-1 family protein [Deltaproteobacteria bacterium]|jgi:FtsH-binding integral membrane protein|nr:Bax inhibitor-1 family protein [Deltaproteobacteria bacterium]